jgi:hypothetical protein
MGISRIFSICFTNMDGYPFEVMAEETTQVLKDIACLSGGGSNPTLDVVSILCGLVGADTIKVCRKRKRVELLLPII